METQIILICIGLVYLTFRRATPEFQNKFWENSQPNYLIDKCGLTEEEARIFNMIPQSSQREKYLSYIQNRNQRSGY